MTTFSRFRPFIVVWALPLQAVVVSALETSDSGINTGSLLVIGLILSSAFIAVIAGCCGKKKATTPRTVPAPPSVHTQTVVAPPRKPPVYDSFPSHNPDPSISAPIPGMPTPIYSSTMQTAQLGLVVSGGGNIAAQGMDSDSDPPAPPESDEDNPMTSTILQPVIATAAPRVPIPISAFNLVKGPVGLVTPRSGAIVTPRIGIGTEESNTRVPLDMSCWNLSKNITKAPETSPPIAAVSNPIVSTPTLQPAPDISITLEPQPTSSVTQVPPVTEKPPSGPAKLTPSPAKLAPSGRVKMSERGKSVARTLSQVKLSVAKRAAQRKSISPALIAIAQSSLTKPSLCRYSHVGVYEAEYAGMVSTARVIEVPEGKQDLAETVINILSFSMSLAHPTIEKIHGCFLLPNSHPVYITSALPQSSLLNQLKGGPLDWKTSRPIMRQILLGLNFLHAAKRVSHGHLTPQQIQLDSTGKVLITEVGLHLSLLFEEDTALDLPGIAPEVAEGLGDSPASDIWSFGILMYECVSGNLLAQRPESFIDLETLPPGTDPSVIKILQRCVVSDPTQRPSASELLDLL